MNSMHAKLLSSLYVKVTCIFSLHRVYLYQYTLMQFRLEESVDDAFSSVPLPSFLKLLAHDIRWNILALLARSDYSVQEMVRLLKEPQNLVSYHLRRLHEHGLVRERRSTADERSIYYSLDLALLHSRYLSAAESLHPALGTMESTEDEMQKTTTPSPLKKVRVLFLCTENSARSQMAEGILRHLSDGHVEAFSAGSRPSHLHLLAVQTLATMDIDISQQRAKHMDELPDSAFDYVVTVCDRVREACPTFPGDPERIHWSFSDPATVEGSTEDQLRAFEQTALQLITRIRYLLILIAREQREKHE